MNDWQGDGFDERAVLWRRHGTAENVVMGRDYYGEVWYE